MSLFMGLRCVECKEEFDRDRELYSCPNCDGALDAFYDYDAALKTPTLRELKRRHGSMWKYSKLLPIVKSKNIISLGEGGTPLLVASRFSELVGLKNVFIKNEGQNPTGSMKDRQVSVAVSKAVEFGRRNLCVATSGSTALAGAAYSARAGLRCQLVIFGGESRPKELGSPEPKIAGGALCGAKAVTTLISDEGMRDTYDAIRRLCVRRGWVPMTTTRAVNSYGQEGAKTIGYELLEQLNWASPDWVLVPIGSGSMCTYLWKSFKEFREIGLIQDLPKMAAIQTEGYNTAVSAFKNGQPIPSIFDWRSAMQAVTESKGVAEIVKTEDVYLASLNLARCEGIVGELYGVWSIAGVKKLAEDGVIDPDERVVAFVTGRNIEVETMTMLAGGIEAPLVDVAELDKKLW